MKAIWDRIHRWLDANAPAGYGDLRPGATAAAIRAAEKAMGLKLPADVKASYRIHDGQGSGAGLLGGEGWFLLSLKQIVESWGCWARANPKDACSVPIACIGTGDHVFLDLNPDSEDPGCLMSQRRDSAEPDPFLPSFSFWLSEFADELEEGEFVYSEEHDEVMLADELN
jgi:cell wall assembly regulator SMI1